MLCNIYPSLQLQLGWEVVIRNVQHENEYHRHDIAWLHLKRMKLVFRVTICAIASSDSFSVAVLSISAAVEPQPSETLSSACVSVSH
jgi:hypothetical protein